MYFYPSLKLSVTNPSFVFFVQQWHRECFKCANCSKRLDSVNIYCKGEDMVRSRAWRRNEICEMWYRINLIYNLTNVQVFSAHESLNIRIFIKISLNILRSAELKLSKSRILFSVVMRFKEIS